MTSPVWRTREPPLDCSAVAATGAASARLATAAAVRLRDGVDLQVAAADDAVVILAAAADLPWIDGAVYLGWDAGILVPTTWTTSPGPASIRDALGADTDDLVAVLPGRVLVSKRPLRTADPDRIDGSP